jgi:hypothetical protein
MKEVIEDAKAFVDGETNQIERQTVEALLLSHGRLASALSAMYSHFGGEDIENNNIWHPACVKAVIKARVALRSVGVDTAKLTKEES